MNEHRADDVSEVVRRWNVVDRLLEVAGEIPACPEDENCGHWHCAMLRILGAAKAPPAASVPGPEVAVLLRDAIETLTRERGLASRLSAASVIAAALALYEGRA